MSNARYILSKQIARGGMAEIYLGKQIGEDGFQRLCAIKRILPHYAKDDEFVTMFRDEAHICKRLQHANIVRIEDFAEVDDSWAIIMEFVDGADLRTLLAASEKTKSRLSIPMVCHIVAESARGLHYAHTKIDEISGNHLAIVHRDISPQNILVSFEGEVKVTDFGIAAADNKQNETKAGTVKGKYSYMSPEQIKGDKVDPRTDVFAMSVVLWESLTMKRLFHGGSEVETIQLVRKCKAPHPIRDRNPGVDDELEAIVAKGLSKDIKKRYANANDFEKDLRRYINLKYPDFNAQDLGDYLKKTLTDKRAESAKDIQKVLTETNLKPGKKKKKPSKSTNLDFDASSDTNFSISKQITKTGPRRLSSAPTSSQSSRHASSQLGTGRFTKKDMPGYPSRRTSGSKNTLIGSAIAAAISLLIAIYLQVQPHEFSSKLFVRTAPQYVKISIDNKLQSGGGYIKTPANIPITSPGTHLVTISRPGYSPKRFKFEGKSGKIFKKESLVLKRIARFAPTKIYRHGKKARLKIDIADGFVTGAVGVGKKPYLDVKDLIYGRTYTMQISSLKTGKKLFKCKILPRSISFTKPYKVIINTRKKQCAGITP